MRSGHRPRVLALVACLAFPAAATAADRYERVIVRLAGPAPQLHLFPPGRQARAAGVELLLRRHLTARGGSLRAVIADGRRSGAVRRVRLLWIDQGYAITARRSLVARLRRLAGVVVEPDAHRVVPASATPNITLIGAPLVWAHAGAPPSVLAGTRGAGVTVAVLDTGVDTTGQLGASFRGRAADWFDPAGRYQSPADNAGSQCSGHGTQVTGVIVGETDANGDRLGVAPDAKWIAAKIFDRSCAASLSAIHAAFQWTLDPDGDPGTADAPDVINNSWAEEANVCSTQFEPDLVALRAANILPVFAAGNANAGTTAGAGSAESPANLPEAFAVGALLSDGTTILPESARGPSSCTGKSVFPDVVAPGEAITTTDRFGLFTTSSGTSFAAPHVAGTLALLLARHPGMTAEEQAAALTSTAAAMGYVLPDTSYGYGRVDAIAAFESALPAPRDRVAPHVTDLAVAPTFSAGDGPLQLTATATDAVPFARIIGKVATVAAEIDGAPIVVSPADGTLDSASEALVATIDGSALADGSHDVTVRATDDSGNAGLDATTTFTIDRTAPVAFGQSATVGADATLTISVRGSDPGGEVATAEWFDGADPGTGAGHPLVMSSGGGYGTETGFTANRSTFGWAQGLHDLHLRVGDAAGHWSNAVDATIVVPDWLFVDGFEARGLTAWRAHRGAALPRALAALVGRRGLDVPVGSRSAYVVDHHVRGARVLDARFLVRTTGARIRTTARVLAILDRRGHTLAAIELRRRAPGHGTIRLRVRLGTALRATVWQPLPDGTREVDLRLATGALGSGALLLDGDVLASLYGTIRSRPASLRLGLIAGIGRAAGRLAVDGFAVHR